MFGTPAYSAGLEVRLENSGRGDETPTKQERVCLGFAALGCAATIRHIAAVCCAVFGIALMGGSTGMRHAISAGAAFRRSR